MNAVTKMGIAFTVAVMLAVGIIGGRIAKNNLDRQDGIRKSQWDKVLEVRQYGIDYPEEAWFVLKCFEGGLENYEYEMYVSRKKWYVKNNVTPSVKKEAKDEQEVLQAKEKE